MQEYRVVWEVEDLKAKSPADALFAAVEILDQKRSTFSVMDLDGEQWTFPDPRGYDKADWRKAVALGDTDLGFSQLGNCPDAGRRRA